MGIQLDGVALVYPNGHRALHDVTLRIADGEQVAVIGPSGAGKTTLITLLGTALQPSQGRVRILDQHPWELSATALRRLRARLGTAYQTPPLPARQRVVTAVLAGRLGRWPMWKAVLSLLHPWDIPGAGEALAKLGMAEFMFARCGRLSGGQYQRVGLARLLYQQADVMLVDEPVAALDPTLAQTAIDALTTDARKRGATLIVSLHQVELALARFPRVVGLRAGRVQFDAPSSKVDASHLRSLYAASGEHPGSV